MLVLQNVMLSRCGLAAVESIFMTCAWYTFEHQFSEEPGQLIIRRKGREVILYGMALNDQIYDVATYMT